MRLTCVPFNSLKHCTLSSTASTLSPAYCSMHRLQMSVSCILCLSVWWIVCLRLVYDWALVCCGTRHGICCTLIELARTLTTAMDSTSSCITFCRFHGQPKTTTYTREVINTRIIFKENPVTKNVAFHIILDQCDSAQQLVITTGLSHCYCELLSLRWE